MKNEKRRRKTPYSHKTDVRLAADGVCRHDSIGLHQFDVHRSRSQIDEINYCDVLLRHNVAACPTSGLLRVHLSTS